MTRLAYILTTQKKLHTETANTRLLQLLLPAVEAGPGEAGGASPR